MSKLHNLKPDKVIKAFERAGWRIERQTGSHVILSRENYPYILSIPVHKGKPIKQGLIKALIKAAQLTEKEFLGFYK
jgi:predicted RNA binding protein YcfA (HicA-like mRNA interferase family)